MRLVTAEGTTFYYFDPSESWAPPTGLWARRSPSGLVMEHIRRGRPIRLAAFVTMLDATSVLPYFLFWPTEPDLGALDIKVQDGTQSDADFEGSVRTVYQHTHCAVCGHWWHTLIIPTGDPYPGAPDLDRRKLEISQYLLCPNCRAFLRQPVVCVLPDLPSVGE